MTTTFDEPIGCSYCGEDIVTGDRFHTHRERVGRYIHASCLDRHLANKDTFTRNLAREVYWMPPKEKT